MTKIHKAGQVSRFQLVMRAAPQHRGKYAAEIWGGRSLNAVCRPSRFCYVYLGRKPTCRDAPPGFWGLFWLGATSIVHPKLNLGI